MTQLIIILASIICVFLCHIFVALMAELSIKELYKFYLKDEFMASFFIFMSLVLCLTFAITFFAINNTFLHFPY